MTAKEAREAIRVNYGYDGCQRVYQYIQTKIKEAVLENRFRCEVKCPISSFYIDSNGKTHQIANYPVIEKAMSLLREEGFNCRVSQSGENWKVEVEW